MNTSFSIRPLFREDIEYVQKIERLVFSDPWPDEAFTDFLSPWYYALLHDEQVIGYIFYYGTREEREVINFAIQPDFQGMGLGEFLLMETMRLMTEDGGKLIFLEVRISNYKARCLYEKVGFQEIGLRKNYYKKPEEDAIVMVYNNYAL